MPTDSYTYSQGVTRYYSIVGARLGNGTWGPLTTRTYTNLGGTRTVPGYRPKGWAMRRIRLHACTTTPLDGTKSYMECTPTDMSLRRTYLTYGVYYYPTYRTWGDGLPYFTTNSKDQPPNINTIGTSEAENQAKSRYLQDIRRAYGELQSITVAGELLKTIRMIARPGRALRDGLNRWNSTAVQRCRNAIRSKNGWRIPKNKRRAAVEKTLADSWLEWVFGMKPVIYDLDNAARVLAETIHQDTAWAKPVRGSGHSSSRTYKSTRSHTANSNTLYWDVFAYGDASVVFSGKVVLTPNKVLAMRRAGLTFDRWAPAIWELLPYSWLVDYFANIGDVIEGLCTTSSQVRWTQRTEVLDGYVLAENLRHTVGTPSTAWGLTFSPGSARHGNRRVMRRQYFGSLVPSIQFRIPGVSTQWCNIAAVVISGKRAQRSIAQLLN